MITEAFLNPELTQLAYLQHYNISKMKRTKFLKKLNIVLISSVMLLASACQKELFEDPVNSLAPGAAFENAERVEKASVGMYNALQNANYFGGRVLVYADIRGTDVNPPSYFNPLPQFTSVTASNSLSELAWQGAYVTIGEANSFMKGLEASGNIVAASKRDQYVGEAKFIRALSYFYLVNLWAQPYRFTASAGHPGVPLVLTSSNTPFGSENEIPRATVAQVYTQMEQDLLEAENKLPADYGQPALSDVARATKGAARGLLARLYLYKGDYTNANIYADKVIGADKYDLNSNPATTFTTYTSRESIFSVAMSVADNPNTNNALGQHYGAAKRGDITVSTDYIGLMEQANDLRFKNLIQQVSGSYWTLKYPATESWVPVLRYAEILLIKAEALANLSADVDPTAVALLNQVRGRSLATVRSPQSKSELLADILTERRIELAFEGQGELDYLRTGRGIPAHSVIAAQAYGSDYVILPIPLYELQKNPKLKQNPGY